MEEGGQKAGCVKPSPVSPSQTEAKPPVPVWVKAEPALDGWEVWSGPWKGYGDSCRSSFGIKSEASGWGLSSEQDGIGDYTSYMSVKQEEPTFGKGVVVMRGEDFIVEVDPDYESEDEVDIKTEVKEESEGGEMEVCVDSSAAMAGAGSSTRQTGQSLCPASACLASRGEQAGADGRGRNFVNSVHVPSLREDMAALVHSVTDRVPGATVDSPSLENALHLGREGNVQSVRGGMECKDSNTLREKSAVGTCHRQVRPVHLVKNRSWTEGKRRRRKTSCRKAVTESPPKVPRRDLRGKGRRGKGYRARDLRPSGEGVPCQVCGKEFTLKGNMVRHMATVHRGERRFKCADCGRAFSQKASLKRHCTWIHGDDARKLICSQCGRRFNGRRPLDMHLRTSKRGRSPSPCSQCGKKFLWKCALKTHVCS